MSERVTFEVQSGWPTPNHCRRVAAALDDISPAKYGDILRAYADAADDQSPAPDSGEAASEGNSHG